MSDEEGGWIVMCIPADLPESFYRESKLKPVGPPEYALTVCDECHRRIWLSKQSAKALVGGARKLCMFCTIQTGRTKTG